MRLALVVFASSLVACTADFAQFEPGVVDAVADDSSTADSSSADSEAVDSGTAEDSTTVMDTGTAPTDTGTAPTDTGTAPDTSKPDTSVTDTGGDGAAACTEAESKTLGGHCYFPINAVKWNNASSSCMGKGAHLVTITSAAEETLVESIRPGKDRWIGLSRPAGSPSTEASFVWVTAEAVSYKKWASGEPNGSGECVRLRASNDWGDQGCNTNLDAICERE
ncbi:MAG: C-type lectin domain-containing protein [Polyangiales bacterium]